MIKKRFLSMLVLLIMAVTGARAQGTQTLTVYDGTEVSNSLPALVQYFNGSLTKSQFVIPATDLEAMEGGTITAMKFYTSSSSSYTTTCNVDVFLKEVDYTEIYSLEAKSDVVYHGTLSFEAEGGSLTITLTTPFTYKGDNLLIGIENTEEGTGGEEAISFYGQTVQGASLSGRFVGAMFDVMGDNFIPKTTFFYTPGTVACEKPQLVVSNVSGEGATLTCSGGSGTYHVQYKLSEATGWTDVATNSTETTFTLTGLTSLKEYNVRVQSICDAENTSAWRSASFTTTAHGTIGDYWSDGFEGENTSWEFTNGNCANAWAWGTAVNNGGEKALYITNDYGSTNAYYNDIEIILYAKKRFTFTNGKYEFSYDWRANGESTLDFLRVALVPFSEDLQLPTASVPSGFSVTTLPSGWIALDGGSKLNKVTEWQSKQAVVNNLSGDYYLVFVWRNDDGGGTNPPAAIDNVSIRRITCTADAEGLAVSDVTANSATISWTEVEGTTQWQVAYSTNSSFDGATEVIVNSASYNMTNLAPSTKYYVRVRAYCGGTDYGTWSNVSIGFTTFSEAGVVAVDDYWSDDFEGESCSWELINGTQANAWVWGTAANNGGEKALYISNDGGTTNAYTNNSTTMVYARKGFTFTNGKYQFSFDWRANGESYSDILRVALVPVTADYSTESVPSGFSASELPDGWIALDGGSELSQVTQWQSKQAVVNDLSGEYFLLFAWSNDDLMGTDPPAAIDNVSITKILCSADVEGLAASDITTTSATISWTAVEGTQWQVAYSTNSAFEGATEEIVNSASYNITNLSPSTTYYVRVRSYCGGTDYGVSSSIRFSTTSEPVAIGDNWSDDFEGESCGWELLNEGENAWAWGTAVNNGGVKALYISNNGGTTNAYTNGSATMVYARKLLIFDDAKYEFSYDWKANGEGSYDFLRVALVPVSETLTAGSAPEDFSASKLPSGWIALDGGSKLNQVTTWQNKTVSKEVSGNYYLVFAWKNDNSGGTNPPAAIDNVSIRKINCSAEAEGLAASNITGTSATISWTEVEGAEWQVVYSTNSTFEGATEEIVSSASYDMTNLTTGTKYYVRVRSYCGGTNYGSWSNVISVKPTDDFIVHAGDETNQYVPFYGNMANYAQQNQMIYPATELTDLVGQSIFEMKFYISSVRGTNDIGNWIVSLGETDATTLSGLDTNTPLTQVYSGAMTFNSDESEMTITFDGDGYAYHGGNLLVEFNHPVRGKWKEYAFYGETVTGASFCYSKQRNFLPKTAFTFGAPPAYPMPTDLTSSEITPTAATLSWTETGTATEWEICLNGDEENLISADSNPFTVTGLTPETVYAAKVRAVSGSDYSRWSKETNFTTLVANPIPFNVAATTVKHNSAKVAWTGYSDSYVARISEKIVTTSSYDFEGNEIPANFTNSATYPWTLQSSGHSGSSYCAIPGNKGVNSSTSDLTCVVSGPGIVSFWAKVSSEGNYDKGRFLIDGDEKFAISGTKDWTEYSYELTEGEHTLIWRYYKDSSSASGDDLFYVDDITITTFTFDPWSEYAAIGDSYTFSGLNINTLYSVQVKGVKDGYADTEWTKAIDFTTPDTPASITLAETDDNTDWLTTNDGVEYNVTLTRTLQTGGWNTFAVPFDLDIPEGWTVKELSTSDFANGTLTLNFGDATGIVAGTPYLVRVDAAVANPTFDGVIISKTAVPAETTYADFIPVFSPTNLTGGDKSVLFVTGGDKLTYPAADGNINGFRAYFLLHDVPAAGVRAFAMSFDDDATSITTVLSGEPTTASGTYDLQGRRIEGQPTQKGVYIVNGKKTIK